MPTKSILVTIGSLVAGAAIAAVTVVGLVSSQTRAGSSPTDVTQPVTIDYGTTG